MGLQKCAPIVKIGVIHVAQTTLSFSRDLVKETHVILSKVHTHTAIWVFIWASLSLCLSSLCFTLQLNN